MPDLHTGNIAFTNKTPLDQLSEESVINKLGLPQTSPVLAPYGKPLTASAHVPRYLVWPASLSQRAPTIFDDVKIMDFGVSVLQSTERRTPTGTLRTPLALHVPEVLFAGEWDNRVDLWIFGCTIFELVTGQPPFDSILGDKPVLIRQMIQSIGNLPANWRLRVSDIQSIGMSVKVLPSLLASWLLTLYRGAGV
ncbi:hypothetical protein AAFC00_004264 [Neodothiora populina]|uniref:Protein kinase domain-containing protein n=1 Tax=Neodothiora populina TaxID=2781224 RepID=A0ABR3PJC4_9PEZI